jgi:hypothetical protein
VNRERQLIILEDTITKRHDQTIWYENDQLIKEYLESSNKTLKLKAVSRREKLSLLELIKKSMADSMD